MTPHAQTYSSAPAEGDKPDAGAPEVTAAMLAAGLDEYNSVWTELRDAVPGAETAMLARAFRAMNKLVQGAG